jgi:hypothetical protein
MYITIGGEERGGGFGDGATKSGEGFQGQGWSTTMRIKVKGVYVYSILLIWLCSGDNNYICQVFK